MPPKGGKSANNNRDTIVAMCGSDEECLPSVREHAEKITMASAHWRAMN
jgi:hypothetical protein